MSHPARFGRRSRRRSWTPRPVLAYSCSLPLLVLGLRLVPLRIADGLLAARVGCGRYGAVSSLVAPGKMLTVKQGPSATSLQPKH